MRVRFVGGGETRWSWWLLWCGRRRCGGASGVLQLQCPPDPTLHQSTPPPCPGPTPAPDASSHWSTRGIHTSHWLSVSIHKSDWLASPPRARATRCRLATFAYVLEHLAVRSLPDRAHSRCLQHTMIKYLARIFVVIKGVSCAVPVG